METHLPDAQEVFNIKAAMRRSLDEIEMAERLLVALAAQIARTRLRLRITATQAGFDAVDANPAVSP